MIAVSVVIISRIIKVVIIIAIMTIITMANYDCVVIVDCVLFVCFRHQLGGTTCLTLSV